MLADELSKLRELHDAGELSDDEYRAAKAQLLKQPKALMQPRHPDSNGLGGMTPSTYATVLHLSHYGGLMLPFAGFIIPIGMWLYAKDQNEFIDQHGRSSANFIVSYFIYSMVIGALYFAAIAGWLFLQFSVPFFVSPFFLLFIPGIPFFIIWAIFPIFGAIAASKGQPYRYPLTFNLF
jgi:uncharacterized protein